MPRRNVKSPAARKRAQLGAKRQRAIKRAAKPVLIEVRITRAHSINGQRYDTSPVKVTREIADILLEQEQRAKAEDRRFRDMEPQDTVIVGRRLYKMPRGTLSDQSLLTVTPIGVR